MGLNTDLVGWIMPKIDLSQDVYDRLFKLATGFDDTADTVLCRLLDAFEKPAIVPQARPPAVAIPVSGIHSFDPRQPPDLTHAKLLSASFDGTWVQNPKWNRLLDYAVQRALQRKITWESIRQLAGIRIIPGEKVDDGFHFLADVNVSVQGQDANAAWRATVSLAKALTCDVEATFKWRDKDGATRPGASGRLRFP